MAAHATPGTLARWEMTGLMAGALAGLLFAVLAVYCVVGCGGRLRTRIADPVLLTLAVLGVLELLVHRASVPFSIAPVVRGGTTFAWLVGLLFVCLAIRYRPRRPVQAVEEAEADTVDVPGAAAPHAPDPYERRPLAEAHHEEREDG
jgi:hypothetical protein